MDEREMENTLPSVDDTVSDAPPEPEESVLEEYSYGTSTEEETKTEPQAVLQEPAPAPDEPEEDDPAKPSAAGFSYGEESSLSAPEPEEHNQEEPSASGYEYGEGTRPKTASTNFRYEENRQQQASPPSGYHYGEDTPPPHYGYQQGYTPKRTNGMALASLILGILSIVMCCCGGFGVILGAVGIVLAILSRGREPMETNAKVGLGLSIGGIVLGIVVLILAFVMMGSDDIQSELYRRSRGSYGDYDYYFDYDSDHDHDGF